MITQSVWNFWLPAGDNRADLRIAMTGAHALWWRRGIWRSHCPIPIVPPTPFPLANCVWKLGCCVSISIQGLFLHAGVKSCCGGHWAVEVHQARLVSIGMLDLGLSRPGAVELALVGSEGEVRLVFGAAIRVVEHWVTRRRTTSTLWPMGTDFRISTTSLCDRPSTHESLMTLGWSAERERQSEKHLHLHVGNHYQSDSQVSKWSYIEELIL